MKTWMLTAPRHYNTTVQTWKWFSQDPIEVTIHLSKWELRYLADLSDVKEYTIGIEKGKKGYEHYQARFKASDTNLFERWTAVEPQLHLQEAEVDQASYERKEGRFWASMDTKEIRIQRFHKPNAIQQHVIDLLNKTNDREIVLWYSDRGGIGKSWLVGHLWETGQAYLCQPQDTVKGMKQDIASDYMKHGWRPYIVVDLPRTWKWTKDLYCALESIKDGLIKDTRYSADTINIKGVKVLVVSNTLPKFDNLSYDRWIFVNNTEM
ncbi:Rep [Porprismacovirus bovas3]|uniref:Rep n=1 Tax=Genomoviridae sp. TaxID=2202565 RepID=A0A4D6TYG4_9VIRU|nr:Rep [Genomoviridae sp.]